MRRMIIAIILLALASPVLAVESEPQPKWCQKGYVCLRVEELAERTAVVWELRADLARSKAKQRRLGGVVGCGAGVSGVVVDGDEGWRFETVPAIQCGVMWGIRF